MPPHTYTLFGCNAANLILLKHITVCFEKSTPAPCYEGNDRIRTFKYINYLYTVIH